MPYEINHNAISTLDKFEEYGLQVAYEAVLQHLITTEQLPILQQAEIKRAYEPHLTELALQDTFSDADFTIAPDNYWRFLGFSSVEAYQAARNKILQEMIQAYRDQQASLIQAHQQQQQEENQFLPEMQNDPDVNRNSIVADDQRQSTIVFTIEPVPQPALQPKIQQTTNRVYLPNATGGILRTKASTISLRKRLWGTFAYFILELGALITGFNVYRGIRRFMTEFKPKEDKNNIYLPMLLISFGAGLLTPVYLIMRLFDSALIHLGAKKDEDIVEPFIKELEDKEITEGFYHNYITSYAFFAGAGMLAFSVLVAGSLSSAFSNAFDGASLHTITKMGQGMLEWTLGQQSPLLGGLVTVFAVPAFVAVISLVYAAVVTTFDEYFPAPPAGSRSDIYDYYEDDIPHANRHANHYGVVTVAQHHQQRAYQKSQPPAHLDQHGQVKIGYYQNEDETWMYDPHYAAMQNDSTGANMFLNHPDNPVKPQQQQQQKPEGDVTARPESTTSTPSLF